MFSFIFEKQLFEMCVFGLLSLKRAFVYQEKQMMVYVERRVADDATLSKDEAFGSIRNQLCTFREGETPACPTATYYLCLKQY